MTILDGITDFMSSSSTAIITFFGCFVVINIVIVAVRYLFDPFGFSSFFQFKSKDKTDPEQVTYQLNGEDYKL